MIQNSRQAFGISPLVPEGKRYVFFEVVAEVIDGKLAMLNSPREAFPTEGNVYIDEKYLVPEGAGAIWRVQQTRTATKGERQAEYSAISRGQSLPYEIVSIAQRSDAIDSVREQLLEGQDIGYSPGSTILVRLGDGVIVGPIRCEPLEQSDRYGYRCRSDAFNDPIGCWKQIGALSPISFLDSEQVARLFTAHITLPSPEYYIDCAPLEHALRAVLRTVREHEDLRKDFSKRHSDTLAHEIATLAPSKKTESRARRVTAALADHTLSDVAVGLLREKLSSDSATKKELEVLREQTRTDAKAELVREQKALATAVKDLSSQRQRLISEIDALQGQARNKEAELLAMADRLAETIRPRLAEVMLHPATLLAEVSLIRPFLAFPSPSPRPIDEPKVHRTPDAGLIRVGAPDSRANVDSPLTLLSTIEHNLMSAGLASPSARRVGREVCASALAGQATMFGGSLANELARCVAVAFAGEGAYEYQVPVGLFDGRALAGCLRQLLNPERVGDNVVALVLEGMNRSATEAYAQSVREYVSEQQLGSAIPNVRVVLLGTLCRGPSALETTPALCEFGPILDTDCLALGTKTAPPAIGGQVAVAAWNEWRQPNEAPHRPAALEDGLRDAMEGEVSLLWRRVVLNALKRLAAIEPPGGSTPLQSLAYGWLVPRAHSAGVAVEKFSATLQQQTVSGDETDPRLRRLLAKLYPTSGSA